MRYETGRPRGQVRRAVGADVRICVACKGNLHVLTSLSVKLRRPVTMALYVSMSLVRGRKPSVDQSINWAQKRDVVVLSAPAAIQTRKIWLELTRMHSKSSIFRKQAAMGPDSVFYENVVCDHIIQCTSGGVASRQASKKRTIARRK